MTFPKTLVAPVALATISLTTQAWSAGGTVKFTVKKVPTGDMLNIRQLPNPASPIVGKINNGDQGFMSVLDCWNSKTGKPVPPAKLSHSKPNIWCSVQAGSDGDINGYANYKYLY